jgi:amino acid transporter/nucleotide-binding universal stress UspA family protein
MDLSLDVKRPRNVDWKRAAALLYGDWGTSKAYVIGLAFAAAAFSSFPLIIAVSLLTAVVGFNYIIVCKHFPDGGGVYSAARMQSRLLAAVGALLLVANFMVTADVSGWAAVSYFGVPPQHASVATIALIAIVGAINFFGPKHSGALSMWLAVPAVAVVLAIIALSVPHLTTNFFEPLHEGFGHTWIAFTGVILALSGVEAVANITGVMPLDRNSTPEQPRVTRTASKSILPVAAEVVLGTVLLGWAMLSLPKVMGGSPEEISRTMLEHKEDMLRLLGERFGAATIGPWFGSVFGIVVGVIFGLLLFSAVNTAVVALIGVLYMMAQDGDMPRGFTRLNRYGVPTGPLMIATGLPIVVLLVTKDFEALAGLYAIGVVGAITVNLGSCTTNFRLPLSWWERALMGVTFLILFAVEITLARTKPDALFFAVCVLGIGLGVRAYSHRLSGLKTVTISREVAQIVTPEVVRRLTPRERPEGGRIMVAARGVTPVLRFALEEARMRKAALLVLYVKEIAVFITGPTPGLAGRQRWEDDPQASAIMQLMVKLGQENGVDVLPVYAVSTDPAATILDLTATLGIDYLMLGGAHRLTMAKLLKGDVVEKVAAGLPEDIQLIIYG